LISVIGVRFQLTPSVDIRHTLEHRNNRGQISTIQRLPLADIRRNGAPAARKEWFRKTWVCQNVCGFLPFAAEEVLGDGLSKSVEDLKQELIHFVDDVETVVAEFWQEALNQTD
jgi:hypothetical protein